MTRTLRSRLAASFVLSASLVTLTAPPANAATVTIATPLTTTYVGAAGASATQLAQALVGPGVTVSGAVATTGTSAQLGRIHIADAAVVSFNDGIILASGDIANVAGPNKSESVTGVGNGNSDPDLTALIANSQTVVPYTFDAASLEFDFVPTASKVYFTYVFGSDEYLEWVNLFNDVFGFFITANGSSSPVNCATVPDEAHPGQTLPVSIDSVNSTVNTALYRDNGYLTPPASPLNLEPDGLTVELICSATVVPNLTNHMKLAIADTSDQVLDSFVMIKVGSLSTIPPESCNDGIDDNADGKIDMEPGKEDPECSSQTYVATSSGSTGATQVTGTGSNSMPPPFSGNPGDDTMPGAGITLDGSIFGWDSGTSGVFDAATAYIAWEVTGKTGTPTAASTCTVSPAFTPITEGAALTPVTAYCPIPGEYKAAVTGWESTPPTNLSGGGDTGGSDVDFWVKNAPPSVELTSPLATDTYAPGTTVTVTAPVVDTADDTVTCTINWGDGSPTVTASGSTGECTKDHTYASDNTYLVSITAADGSGATSGAAVAVKVTTPGLLAQTIDVTIEPPPSAMFDETFTIAAAAGESGNAANYTASGGCSHVGAVYTMTSGTVACQVGISIPGNGTYAPVSTTLIVAATTASQAITWTSPAPASATFGTSFTLAVTESGTGNPLTVGTTGGCTNTGLTVTMTSGTTACSITVQQTGTANHGESNTLTAIIAAGKASQVGVTVAAKLRKGRSTSLAAATPQGLAVQVTVSGKCKVAAVRSGGAVSRWKVTAKKSKGTCTVRVRNAGSTNYTPLDQIARIKVS